MDNVRRSEVKALREALEAAECRIAALEAALELARPQWETATDATVCRRNSEKGNAE